MPGEPCSLRKIAGGGHDGRNERLFEHLPRGGAGAAGEPSAYARDLATAGMRRPRSPTPLLYRSSLVAVCSTANAEKLPEPPSPH